MPFQYTIFNFLILYSLLFLFSYLLLYVTIESYEVENRLVIYTFNFKYSKRMMKPKMQDSLRIVVLVYTNFYRINKQGM